MSQGCVDIIPPECEGLDRARYNGKYDVFGLSILLCQLVHAVAPGTTRIDESWVGNPAGKQEMMTNAIVLVMGGGVLEDEALCLAIHNSRQAQPENRATAQQLMDMLQPAA